MGSLAGKKIWQVFFIVSCGVVIWFLFQFGIRMIPYLRLSHMVDAEIESFVVKEIANEKFAVQARYLYCVDGKNYKKEYIFISPVFLNRFAAQSHIDKHWSTKEWRVWYSYKNPEYASLQKLFPFKFLFNACLSMGIVFYFVWLRSYVARVS